MVLCIHTPAVSGKVWRHGYVTQHKMAANKTLSVTFTVSCCRWGWITPVAVSSSDLRKLCQHPLLSRRHGYSHISRVHRCFDILRHL
jgi:hypothetical protein